MVDMDLDLSSAEESSNPGESSGADELVLTVQLAGPNQTCLE